MGQSALGMRYLANGFQLLLKQGLKRFVIMPLIINILIFTALFFVFRHYAQIFDNRIAHILPAWLQWLSAVIWLLFIISFFIVFIYTFVTLANVIAAPFNSLLAEKVEYYLTGKETVSRSWAENIKDMPRIFIRQLTIVGYYLPRALLILILFFIPVIQAIAPLIWFLFNAWFLTLTYLDYPSDNHKIALTEVRQQMKQQRWLSLGFGASILIVSMIPVINFFVIPAAVAGATQYWLEAFNKVTYNPSL